MSKKSNAIDTYIKKEFKDRTDIFFNKSISLYKYCNTSIAEKILTDNTIFLTNPADFNDPFDCHPSQEFFDLQQKSMNERLKQMAKDFDNPEKKHLVMEMLNTMANMFPQFSHSPELLVQRYFLFTELFQPSVTRETEIKRVMYEYTGVSCFSDTRDNILLWSHYASNHRGVCLCFDSKKIGKIGLFAKVKYVSELTEYDFTNVVLSLTTKYNFWEYESEYRLIKFDIGDEKQRVWSLPENSITAVIFGCQCNLADIKKITDLALQNNKSIRTYRIRTIRGKFGLEIFDYDLALAAYIQEASKER